MRVRNLVVVISLSSGPVTISLLQNHFQDDFPSARKPKKSGGQKAENIEAIRILDIINHYLTVVFPLRNT